jgi:hypothetical protein
MAQKQRQWQTKRKVVPKVGGWTHWDQAYQLLLQIAQQEEEKRNTIHPKQEVAHENS